MKAIFGKIFSLDSRYYTQLISWFFLLLSSLHFLRYSVGATWWDGSLGSYDWDQHYFFLEILKESILEYGEFPAWNPYYSGGLPVFENPQIKFPSITFLLSLFVDTPSAFKISFFLYYLLGVTGFYYLFQNELKVSNLLSIMGVILIMQSGWYFQHFYPGHANFLNVPLIPWIMVCISKSFYHRKWIWIFLSGILLAYLVWDGNIYFFLYSYLIFSISIIISLVNNEYRRFIPIFMLILFLGIGLSLFRILPSLEYKLNFGFYYKEDPAYQSLSDIWKIFTIRSQHPYLARNFTNQSYNWWEYGNYIGVFPFFLFIVAFLGFNKGNRFFLTALLILISITLLLMMGNFGKYSPAFVLKELPGYSNLRCYSRWSYYFVIFLTIFTISGWNSILSYSKDIVSSSLIKMFLIFIIIFLSYDLSSVNSKIINNAFPIPKSTLMDRNSEVLDKLRNFESYNQSTISTILDYPSLQEYSASSMYPTILLNLSTFHGYDVLNRFQNVSYLESPQYKGEAHLSNPGILSIQERTPSKIHLHIYTDSPNEITINQNYNKNWKIRSIKNIDSDSIRSVAENVISISTINNTNNRLTITIPKGNYSIKLYYWNSMFTIGCIIAVLCIALSILILPILNRRYYSGSL